MRKVLVRMGYKLANGRGLPAVHPDYRDVPLDLGDYYFWFNDESYYVTSKDVLNEGSLRCYYNSFNELVEGIKSYEK